MTLTSARQRRIVDLIESDREVVVAELAREFSVSEMTIRRDLKSLEKKGRLRRVRGGAVVPAPVPGPLPLHERMGHQEAAKRGIAELAATLVQPGHRIYIGPGSTTFALAQRLAQAPPLKVLANVTDIADVLARGTAHAVELTGGLYDADCRNLNGEAVLQAVRDRVFDISFVSAYAFDTQFGILDNGDQQFHVQRLLSERSRLHVVLADHTKFGRAANYRTLTWSRVDVFVTDHGPEPDLAARLESAGVRLLCPDAPADHGAAG